MMVAAVGNNGIEVHTETCAADYSHFLTMPKYVLLMGVVDSKGQKASVKASQSNYSLHLELLSSHIS